MKAKDNFWQTIGVALVSFILWAIVAGFFASQASGQEVDTIHFVPIPVILVDSLPYGSIGTIACDTFTNKPVAMIDRHILGTKSFAETLTHEMRHVKQVWLKGCKESLKDFGLNPATRLKMEGAAYCEMYQTYYKGEAREALINALPSLLYYRHRLFPLTTAEVKRKTDALCGQIAVAMHSP